MIKKDKLIKWQKRIEKREMRKIIKIVEKDIKKLAINGWHNSAFSIELFRGYTNKIIRILKENGYKVNNVSNYIQISWE